MNPGLIQAAGAMLKDLISLTHKAMDFADAEKHVKCVEELHKGSDTCFRFMRDVVQNDPHMSTAEKLDRLAIIEEKERAAKQHYSKMLDQHQANAMAIVKDVFIGFLTAGIYFVPGIVRQIRSELKKEQIPATTIQEVFDYVEINSDDK